MLWFGVILKNMVQPFFEVKGKYTRKLYWFIVEKQPKHIVAKLDTD